MPTGKPRVVDGIRAPLIPKNAAKQLATSRPSETDVRSYLDGMRALLPEGEIQPRQELLRRFIKQVVLYRNHAEIAYKFGLSTLARLGEEEVLTAL